VTAVDEPLAGMPTPRGRERYGIEIVGLGAAGNGAPHVESVRVTLIDHETGKRVGACVMPFEWLRDVAQGGTCLANIRPGVWS
jgi:hypothetical protein